MSAGPPPPQRQVRADHDERTLVVYQAYAPEIADPAVAAGTFVPPFREGRMTWIKPSFLWMMHRCCWATKPGQERVLAVRITRAGFEEALRRASLSHHDPAVHGDDAERWRAATAASPVRVQWDPERSSRGEALPWRSIQVGLSGPASAAYVHEWITAVTDVTDLAREVAAAVRAGRDDEAAALLPVERPYPVPADLAARVGMRSGGTRG